MGTFRVSGPLLEAPLPKMPLGTGQRAPDSGLRLEPPTGAGPPGALTSQGAARPPPPPQGQLCPPALAPARPLSCRTRPLCPRPGLQLARQGQDSATGTHAVPSGEFEGDASALSWGCGGWDWDRDSHVSFGRDSHVTRVSVPLCRLGPEEPGSLVGNVSPGKASAGLRPLLPQGLRSVSAFS